MIEVFQAEWCPYSRQVRQRLTELGLPFVAWPVPARREDRDELEARVGTRSIPVAVLDDGTVLAGDAQETVAELNRRFAEPPGADSHRRALQAHGGL